MDPAIPKPLIRKKTTEKRQLVDRTKPIPAKQSRKRGPRPEDANDEFYLTPVKGKHYTEIGVGQYKCLGTGLNPLIPHDGRHIGSLSMVRAHATRCWPNLTKKKAEIAKNSDLRHPDTRVKADLEKTKKYADERNAAMRSGLPTIPCEEPWCNYKAYTQRQLVHHKSDKHTTIRSNKVSLKEFLAQDKWKGPAVTGRGKNEELKADLQTFIDERDRRIWNHYTYLVIFLPIGIDTVDKVWQFFEENPEATVPFYTGKATSFFAKEKFLVEDFHNQRTKSTIFEYMSSKQMAAFQVCLIPAGSDAEASDQEAILQMISEISYNRDAIPGCLKFKIINQRADLSQWEKLPKEDYDEAFEMGLAHQPLLCLNKNCVNSHQEPGKKCFGMLHRNEVDLIPFNPII